MRSHRLLFSRFTQASNKCTNCMVQQPCKSYKRWLPFLVTVCLVWAMQHRWLGFNGYVNTRVEGSNAPYKLRTCNWGANKQLKRIQFCRLCKCNRHSKRAARPKTAAAILCDRRFRSCSSSPRQNLLVRHAHSRHSGSLPTVPTIGHVVMDLEITSQTIIDVYGS